jgi:hypothetical protein
VTDSPAARIRARMNELPVGHLSEFPMGTVADHLPDAIGAEDLPAETLRSRIEAAMPG